MDRIVTAHLKASAVGVGLYLVGDYTGTNASALLGYAAAAAWLTATDPGLRKALSTAAQLLRNRLFASSSPSKHRPKRTMRRPVKRTEEKQ